MNVTSEALEVLGKVSSSGGGAGIIGGNAQGVAAMNKIQPAPNPDTFAGLLLRFDNYLDQLSEIERRAGIHADLLSVEPQNANDAPNVLKGIAKDQSGSVIVQFQQRLDVLSHLIGSTGSHQNRASKAF